MLAPPPAPYRRDKGAFASMPGLAASDRRAIPWAIVAGLTLLFVALGGYFATVQNVWVDESTQLLGSALPLGRLIAWLAGHPEPLGVPADRMPPLGYLVDWTWGRVGGSAPFGYRLLHLAFAGAGVAAMVALAGRLYGPVAALVTGLLLVASPGLITIGVEIRAYPLFFAATALQLWLLSGLCERAAPSSSRLAAFVAAGLVAVYVHFFGLVSSSALFCGLIAARARSRRDVLRFGAAWAALLVLASGIAPFVGGARAISNDAAPQEDALSQAATYLPRIYGHSAMLLHPFLTIVLFLGVVALLAVAAWRAVETMRERPLRERAGLEPALFVALAAGLAATIAAGLVASGFDPMKPSYSIWMVPLIALLAGAACAPGARLARAATVIAALGLLALAPITLAFARHADWFVHGPEGAISAAIGARPADTAIVYVDRDWGYGYFPLVRRFGASLPQFLLDAQGRLVPLVDADPNSAPVSSALLARYRQVLLISIETRTGDDLRALIGGIADPALFAPPAGEIDGWHITNLVVRPGLYWLRLARMERNGRR